MRHRFSCFKETNDDWYPNWNDNQVKVTFHCIEGYTWRVSAWGRDDTGMEYDHDEFAVAYNMFIRLVTEFDYINRSDLTELGFVRA